MKKKERSSKKENIEKISFIVLSFLLLFFAGISLVFGSSRSTIVGHSLDEIDLPNCKIGEALVKTSTGWGCKNLDDQGLVKGTVTRYTSAGNIGKHIFCAIARIGNAEDSHNCKLTRNNDGTWTYSFHKTGCEIVCLD